MKQVISSNAVKSIVIALMAIVGIVSVLLLKSVFPAFYSVYAWAVPGIIVLISFYLAFTLDRLAKTPENKIATKMMLYKAIKLAICCIVLLLFAFTLSKDPKKGILILFLVDYLVLSGLEIFAFSNFERAKKLGK